MEVGKIYQIRYQTWRDAGMGPYQIETVFEGNYTDKIYAQRIYDTKKRGIGYYADAGVDFNEIDVVFYPDGTYREINFEKKIPTKPDLGG
jgi:hypothetical protein